VPTIHETARFKSSGRGTVFLRFLANSAGSETELRIDRHEQLPHKTFDWPALRVTRPTSEIRPLARTVTTIVCELERLHSQGYWLRQRAGGGWRGAWKAELLPAGGSRPSIAWEIELRRPAAELGALTDGLVSLDVPSYRPDRSDDDLDFLVSSMRHHGKEVRRRHGVDALIAADPASPTDDFLRELEARGLLDAGD
jgi:hypothetical protein